MKSVLFAIRPEWAEKILSGEKTLEIRKTRPKIEPPFRGYMYCSQKGKTLNVPISHKAFLEDLKINGMKCMNHPIGNGKVVAEFVCTAITPYSPGRQFSPDKIPFSIRELGRMTAEQLWRYSGGKRVYGLHISDLKVYDKPKELDRFMRPGAEKIEDIGDGLCPYCMDTEYGKLAIVQTPNGPHFCEGEFCEAAYAAYLYDEFAIVRAPQSWCYVEEIP